MPPLLATESSSLLQYVLIGLANGSLYAIIALGYTMVYGIIELINFAHGDLFMLGSFFALTILIALGLDEGQASTPMVIAAVLVLLVATPVFCAVVNYSVDRIVYRP